MPYWKSPYQQYAAYYPSRYLTYDMNAQSQYPSFSPFNRYSYSSYNPYYSQLNSYSSYPRLSYPDPYHRPPPAYSDYPMPLSPREAARSMVQACNNHRWHIAQSLLQLYQDLLVDIRGIGSYDCTPLHAAAAAGQTDFIIALLDAHADVDAEALHGFTPLYLAVRNNRPNAVSLLLQAGAEPDVVCAGYTPLATAVDRGYLQIVQCLLDAGAATFISNPAGDDPLHIAARHGNVEVAQALVEGGADLNVRGADGLVPAMVAYEAGFPELSDMLRTGMFTGRLEWHGGSTAGALVPYAGGYNSSYGYGQVVPYGGYGAYGNYGNNYGTYGNGYGYGYGYGYGGGYGGAYGGAYGSYGPYGRYGGYAGDLSVARYASMDDPYYSSKLELMYGDGMGYEGYGYGLGYGPSSGRRGRYRSRSMSPWGRGRYPRSSSLSMMSDRYHDAYDMVDPLDHYGNRYGYNDRYNSYGYGSRGRYGRLSNRERTYYDAGEIAALVVDNACRGLGLTSSEKRRVFKRVERNVRLAKFDMADITEGGESAETVARILMTDSRGHVRDDKLLYNTADMVRSMRDYGYQ
eukprot:GFKZ01005223.1.p1 GENE.GFKZ01005223.1~~GFKZ01005223.1.p1  ORF type:complete len:668 (+),score=50.45 GFKZ01005223.1:283-2004(+)